MDSLSEGTPDEGDGLSLNQLTTNSLWPTTTAANGNNSTLLYIAVEYVKPPSEFKIEPPDTNLPSPEATYNYDQHVSPLDPNMGSVARYSPIYTEPPTPYSNPVVVGQLVGAESVPAQPELMNILPNSNRTMEISTMADCETRRVESTKYMRMMDMKVEVADVQDDGALQFVPDAEQEVELLITDQATGVSYSVSTQEFLVERCLDEDQQLLDALAHNPLLDAELLALDDNTLKSQLSEMGDSVDIPNNDRNSPEVVITPIKVEPYEQMLEVTKTENLRRSKRQNEGTEPDDVSRLYISDKPILSRARATLPESYLALNKYAGGVGVFARKFIPKRTQFGPIEGVIENVSNWENDSDELKLLIQSEDGTVKRLDISDENTSNWMCFVRRATNYHEHNLALSQQGNSLYYISTRNILPRQQLLVDYGKAYAEKHNLVTLKPSYEDEYTWPCFECSLRFCSSEQLQKHLTLHDNLKDESIRPRKKYVKSKRVQVKKIQKPSILECSICKKHFFHPRFAFLKEHLLEHGVENCASVQDKFVVVKNYRCSECQIWFNSEALLRIHNLQHDVDSFDEQIAHVCPACHHKFPTQRQLVAHVLQHSNRDVQPEVFRGYKCTSCYKIFATRERIQRHMLVHGSEDSKPYQCMVCKKRFLNNSALTCHVKTHYIGKKNFECPICKEKFELVLNLKSHVLKHSENGQYTCPHCQKIFKKYSIIRKHIRAFHCERVHSCQYCSKSFPTLDKLRMHLLRHSDHREFLCADCGKQFKRKDKLKEHCKRMHSEDRENNSSTKSTKTESQNSKKFVPKVEPTDYQRFIYKCHSCMVGFKRRGMLVNHLAKRHPEISPETVPELNLPILRATRDYYCQYCDKVYKSSSKRKAHILKIHPGAALPLSNRRLGSFPEIPGLPNPSYSQTVGSVTTQPQNCQWCHKQYASKAKLLQHQRKKHRDIIENKSTDDEKYDQPQDIPVDKDKQVASVEQDTSVKKNLKVSDEAMISEMIELESDKEGTYYHLVSVEPGEDYNPSTEIIGNTDSRLYRLLTTASNNMVPPR